MGIGGQFVGLPMKDLIGGPLSAVADASINLADSTADFINRVGFDANGNVRNVAFRYEKRSMNDDGTSNLDQMKVDVPMIAIVPIPNLQVDEVNILFDMEVKESEKTETNVDVGANLNVSAKIGVIKISLTGNVSVHHGNVRSTDNSAKYHVDVRATNHGTPEGLARVLDIMAANVAPSLLESRIKDGNGQELPEEERVKAVKRKALREEISRLEKRLAVSRDGLSECITNLKKTGHDQLMTYQVMVNNKLDKLEESTDPDKDKKMEAYQNAIDTVNQSWNSFQNRVADIVKVITDDKALDKAKVSETFGLKHVEEDGTVAAYDSNDVHYNALLAAQNSAVEKQREVRRLETELFEKKKEA